MLDEYGSKSCKSFHALKSAVELGCVDVVSYLLNTYSYPLNIEYTIKDVGKDICTLLTEPIYKVQITKLLLDHGADPAKQMCAANRVNPIKHGIFFCTL